MNWNIVSKPPPHHNVDWARIDVHIRRNADGVERVYETDGILDGDALSTYIWEEGNFACDCNRYDFFQEAGGDDSVAADARCGDDGYLVWIVNPATGDVVYDEREPTAPPQHASSP